MTTNINTVPAQTINKTELLFIYDRSGSMLYIFEPTKKAFDDFVKDQRNLPGELTFTLVAFDDLVETPISRMNLRDVPSTFANDYLSPRGTTALIDACCLGIDNLGQKLNQLSDNEKPDKVMVIILTDGAENASTQFKMQDLNDRIKHQTEKYSWDFIFLGANQDAIATAASMGISSNRAVTYGANSKGVLETMGVVKRLVSSGRGAIPLEEGLITDADRESMTGR